MPAVLLSRAAPLTAAELEQLPLPLAPSALGDGVIARATVDLPLPELARLCFELGRLFPDAALSVEETALALPAPDPQEPAPADPWDLARQGRYAEALPLLQGRELQSAQRDQLRLWFGSRDAAAAAFACRAAQATGWKAAATNLRALLSHGDAQVRLAACDAISHLAGPSMGPALRPLQSDPDPEVRKAAEAGLKRLGW